MNHQSSWDGSMRHYISFKKQKMLIILISILFLLNNNFIKQITWLQCITTSTHSLSFSDIQIDTLIHHFFFFASLVLLYNRDNYIIHYFCTMASFLFVRRIHVIHHLSHIKWHCWRIAFPRFNLLPLSSLLSNMFFSTLWGFFIDIPSTDFTFYIESSLESKYLYKNGLNFMVMTWSMVW